MSKIKRLIRPSSKTDVATIEVSNINSKIIASSMKKLLESSKDEISIDLFIDKNEAISKEAKKRIKYVNILSSST